MNIQKPLLVIYLIFVVGLLSFLLYSNQLVKSTQFAPDSFERMREAAQHTRTVEAAREHIIRYVTLVEMGEKSPPNARG